MGVSSKQSTPNFPKNDYFLPSNTHTYVCVSGGKKYLVFWIIWRALFSYKTRFEIRPFALLPTKYELLLSAFLWLFWKSAENSVIPDVSMSINRMNIIHFFTINLRQTVSTILRNNTKKTRWPIIANMECLKMLDYIIHINNKSVLKINISHN